MLLDDAVSNRQSMSGSAFFISRKKRIKNVWQRISWNSTARIADFDGDVRMVKSLGRH
jgi:predicted transcriptional regulator